MASVTQVATQDSAGEGQTRPGPLTERLLSLDVLRGLTVAGMILVTDPGTYASVYPPLLHAQWNGTTLTDLIFPCFLLMAGISLVLSFSAHFRKGATAGQLFWRATRRSVVLIVLGLIVNGFPYYHLATLRIPGILQRIGVCLFLASSIYLPLAGRGTDRRLRQRMVLGAGAAALLVYWLLLKLYPTPGFGAGHLDPYGNVAAVLDRAVFHQAHMFQWGIKTPGVGITFDPEGILSTLGALATMLVGVWAGDVLLSGEDWPQQRARLSTAVSGLLALALILRYWMLGNKQIYTPPFALWSSGVSLGGFWMLYWLIDRGRRRRGWTPALVFGTNAILAFCLSQVITSLLGIWHIGGEPAYVVLSAHLFATWLPARMASLAWAVCIVVLNLGILYPLYRKRIFVRL
jgi:predicted acyltransferase